MGSIGIENLKEVLGEYVRPVLERGVVGAGSTTTVLNVPGANWVPDQHVGLILQMVSGVDRGEWAKIVANTENTVTVAPALTYAPAAGDEFIITTFGVVTQNVAQWGGLALTGRDVTLDLQQLSQRRATAFPTQTGVDVGTTSTLILPANPDRAYAVICNDSDTVIYLAIGQAAVLNAGIRLNPNGGVYEINWTNLHALAIYGIHGGTGTKRVTVVEGEV